MGVVISNSVTGLHFDTGGRSDFNAFTELEIVQPILHSDPQFPKDVAANEAFRPTYRKNLSASRSRRHNQTSSDSSPSTFWKTSPTISSL
jgi:hypothetical protein